MSFLPAVKGLLLMSSVIVAIGPQNAFLLRQAVRREQAWLVASIFLFGDASMILLGGFGIGHLLEGWPWVKLSLTVLGSMYVFYFGTGVFRQMLHPKALTTTTATQKRGIVTGALAVTFLNPHAIFDTVILVGTLALQFQGSDKIAFMLGAMAASTLWFYGLAWVGQKLAPFLSRADVWRVIDGFIVLVMLILSIMLAIDAIKQAQTILGAA
jgi:L-lysine exporter family protein LysE/ArgO